MSKKSTKLEALHDMFIENGITSEDMKINDHLISEMKKMPIPYRITGILLTCVICSGIS